MNDDGSFATFSDIYGHDARMASAMFGEPMAYDPDPADGRRCRPAPVAGQAGVRQQRGGTAGNSIADSISGFLNN